MLNSFSQSHGFVSSDEIEAGCSEMGTCGTDHVSFAAAVRLWRDEDLESSCP